MRGDVMVSSDARFDVWSETSDQYADTLVILNSEWRIVVCRDLTCWSLQRRRSSPRKDDSRRSPEMPAPGRQPRGYVPPSVDWVGRGFYSASEDLRRAVKEHVAMADPIAIATLGVLPDRIGGPPRKAVPSRKPAPSPSVEELRDARTEDEACPFKWLFDQLTRKQTVRNVAPKASARPVVAAAPAPDRNRRMGDGGCQA
jgi:hypothetical protein